MKDKGQERLYIITDFLNNVCSLFGLTVIGIFDIFSEKGYLGFLICIIVVAVTGIISYLSFKEINKKNQGLLKERNEKLEEKDAEIKKLNEEIVVWKKILMSQIPAQAGHYMANKYEFDHFKTGLVISDCNLDVNLLKDSQNEEDYYLHFDWKLTVLNCSNRPERMAKFIYSSDKPDANYPEVKVDNKDVGVRVEPPGESIGDYRFIDIPFKNPLQPNDVAEISIKYTFEDYKFSPKYDFIWLVPDALGFSGMNRFCIRFFGDDKIIKDTTVGILRSYNLNGSYKRGYDENVIFQPIEESGWMGQCERSNMDEELKEYGYLLIIINNWDSLPAFLQDIPVKGVLKV